MSCIRPTEAGHRTVGRAANSTTRAAAGHARWDAILAPLGAEPPAGSTTPAGFTLAPGFTVSLPTAAPAPLLHDGWVVGTVEHAEARDGMLVASGTVTEPAVATRMAGGALRPRFDLHRPQVRPPGVPTGRRMYTAGTLTAVYTTTVIPCWDQAWFTIQPAPA